MIQGKKKWNNKHNLNIRGRADNQRVSKQNPDDDDYNLLCKFNVGYHNQPDTNLPNRHLSAVNFVMGYEKNMSFLVIPKSPNVWKKGLKKIRLDSFNKKESHLKLKLSTFCELSQNYQLFFKYFYK